MKPAAQLGRALGAAGRIPPPLALVALISAFYPQWHPAFPNPNEASRLYLSLAMVDAGTLSIDAELARHGDVFDKARHAGHAYSDKAPGLSWLALPAVALARLASAGLETTRHLAWLLAVLLPSLAMQAALWVFLGRLGVADRERGLVAFALGLGSLQYSFSTLFFGHATAAALSSLAFLALAARRRGWLPPWATPLAGLLAGWAAITEFPAVMVLVVLGVYALGCLGWRATLAFGAAAALPLALLGAYDLACFGSPFAIGYEHVVSTEFAAVHARGLWGVGLASARAFAQSAFSASRGVLYFSPWLVLAVPGLWLLGRSRRFRAEAAVIAAVTLGFVYLVSSFGYWQGGGTVGQRHFTVAVPFLALALAAALAHARARSDLAAQVLAAALILCGLVATVVTTVPWPYPSIEWAQPLAALAVPLWREGVLPLSVLERLGLGLAVSTAAFALAASLVVGAVAAGDAGAPARARLGQAALVLALACLGVRGLVAAQPAPFLASHWAKDRAGIVRLVDWRGRAPLTRERRELELRATAAELEPAAWQRLGFLRARDGEMDLAAQAYRAAGGLRRLH